MTETASRVKLKNHVYFGMVADGVLFDAGDASFVVKDSAAYPVVAKLVALIDAGNPVAAIVNGAPPRLAAYFERILALLHQHGMLLAVDDAAPSATELAAHTPLNELRKFLEDRLDGRSVDAALRRWSETSVIVAGGGQALLSAVRALCDCGCNRLTVVPDGEATAELLALSDEIAASHALRFAIGARPGDGQTAPTGAAGMLLYASDAGDAQAARRLECAMRERGVAGAIGAVFDGRACVLPAAQADHPGLADLLHWLPPNEARPATLGPVAMGLLGCVAAQAALCRFFGVETPATAGQAAIVSASLEVAYHPLVACAGAHAEPVALVLAPKYQTPDWRALLPFEQVRYALEPWIDPVLGPFDIVADDHGEQVPLLHYPVRVRSAAVRGQEVLVVGWGLEHAAAVLHGLSQAIEAFAGGFAPGGVASVCEFDEASWKRRALAHAVAGSAEMAVHQRWAWVDLADLPPGPARILQAVLRFHAPDGIQAQLQWVDAGDAFVARLLRCGETLCELVAADPVDALAEGLGLACSQFQLRQPRAPRFGRHAALPPAHPAAQVADWRAALAAAEASAERGLRPADFHRTTGPGFPSTVYCGHATLRESVGIPCA